MALPRQFILSLIYVANDAILSLGFKNNPSNLIFFRRGNAMVDSVLHFQWPKNKKDKLLRGPIQKAEIFMND